MTRAGELVRRRWWLFVLAVLAAALPTVLVSDRLPRVYEARATVAVSPGSSAELGSGLSPDQLTATYAGMIKTRPILDAVAGRAGLSREQLEARLTVTPVRDTRFIQLLVRATTPEQAADLANLVATTAAEQLESMRAARYSGRVDRLRPLVDAIGQDVLGRAADVQALAGQAASPERDAAQTVAQSALAQAQQRYRDAVARLDDFSVAQLGGAEAISIAEPALPPERPVLPRPGVDLFTAVIVGLVIASVLALILERFVDPLPSAAEWPRVFDVPLLGVVDPFDPTSYRTGAETEVDDAFSGVLAHLQSATADGVSGTLAVMSVSPGGGATVVAAGLATALARTGELVILVDANLQRPSLASLFGVRARYDLNNLLSTPGIRAGDAAVDTRVTGLRVVAAGSPSADAEDLLSSPALTHRFAELLEVAGVVVIDAPPTTCSETLIVATGVDAVICVLDPSRTSLSETRQAIAQLRAVGAPLRGVVFNRLLAAQPMFKRDAMRLQPSPEQS